MGNFELRMSRRGTSLPGRIQTRQFLPGTEVNV